MKRSFRFSFGSKPPVADEEMADMLDRAFADAAQSPDGTGAASFSAAIDRVTGLPVPLDDPAVQELLRRAQAEAAKSPDGTGMATDSQTFTVEFSDGKLRVNRGGAVPSYEDPSQHTAEDPQAAREREMWDRLHLIAEGKGAYPDTQRWHQWLSTATWIITITLPLAALILTLVTQQTAETVFFVTFGAAIIAAMFRSSIR